MKLCFLFVSVLAALFAGCMENPVGDVDGGDVDSSNVVVITAEENSGEITLKIVAQDDPWGDNVPEKISAVGLFGNWNWESEASAVLSGGQYKIEATVDTGIYFFNLKGKANDSWADTSKLSLCEHWLNATAGSWLVVRVTKDGEALKVSKKTFDAWLKAYLAGEIPRDTTPEVEKLVSSKAVKYGLDTLDVIRINGKNALVTSVFSVVTSWKFKGDTTFIYDTIGSKYIVATKIFLDTTKSVKDTINIPRDTIWLSDAIVGGDTVTVTKRDTVTIYDTDTITIKQSATLRVVSYKDDGIDRGIYELAFRWYSGIVGSTPFVKGVPDWNKTYSLGLSYGDTARGIKVSLIEGKVYSCGYGAKPDGAWALVPCDDRLAEKPDGSDYCQLKFVPWKGRLYVVEEFNLLKPNTTVTGKDTLRDTLHDTLYLDTSGTKVIIIPTKKDTVFIDTSRTDTQTVYIDTSKVIIIYVERNGDSVDTTIYVDTSGGAEVIFIFDSLLSDTGVDRQWLDTTILFRDTGVVKTSAYARADSLLIQQRTELVQILIFNLSRVTVDDGDTAKVLLRRDTTMKVLSVKVDTLDNIIKPLAVLDGGEGVYQVRVGVHQAGFADTVKPNDLAMVGDYYLGGVSGANPTLNWTTGIQSQTTKEGKYFVFILTLKEGDVLSKFNFRHINGTWTSRNAEIIQLSPKWRDDDTGFGMKFVNGELIPSN